ncbi:response regulator transcription factor [Micromonospora lutea]|uniref:DNA-binding response regulator n=1 Tax=Micromonospora lutea TaxID=419825 RepID=A0ABQ4J1Z4_9ACTN|nr:response regulator transcription factor [Micromonospora lutea]GIJ24174.1 DNA-binding response regulator [Micromonospora lutea]
MAIDVLVSDVLHLSRFALTALLAQEDEFRVVGSMSNYLDAVEFAELHRPDVVIISFQREESDAVAFAEKVASVPGCRSMLLATSFTRPVVRRAFAGEIAGLVQRDVPPRQFFDAIRRVHLGERVFDAELTVAALGNGDCPLTPRELSVLTYVYQGDTVGEIAARLRLSDGTVRNYLSSVVAKLSARNRIDALRIARESHWI